MADALTDAVADRAARTYAYPESTMYEEEVGRKAFAEGANYVAGILRDLIPDGPPEDWENDDSFSALYAIAELIAPERTA